MATGKTVLYAYLMALQMHCCLAGLSAKGQRLNIRKFKDIRILRQELGDDCKVKYLDARWVGGFNLTSDDIDVLSRCPLVSVYLFGTACFTPSAAEELYKLSSLSYLCIRDCIRQTFVIKNLPDSLVHLRIEGLTERNIHLNNSNGKSLSSLQKLDVRNASMCCPDAMIQTFGKYLPEVTCRYHAGKFIVVNCGLSDDETSLSITSPSHVSVLRERLGEDCSLNKLFVELHDFTLTTEDVDILRRCSLKELYLADSRCFSASVGDLSKLVNVTHIGINHCRKADFVITRLPESLQWLDVRGLAEFNIRIDNDDGRQFGEHLSHLEVKNGALCCAKTLTSMFTRDLSAVCEARGGYRCGVWRLNNGPSLAVDTRGQFQHLTDQLQDKCDIKRIWGAGREFFLTQDDVDVLAECPVSRMFLPYTSCFSGQIDLSNLTMLDDAYFPHCASLNFSITGLPTSLKKFDIRGWEVDNIQIKNRKKTPFGSSLTQLEVSDPTICSCPQAAVKMFGSPLQETTTCGLTETVYSANQLQYSVGFQSEGLDSAVSSCEHLIEDRMLRILLWVMAVVATGGNCAVIVYRLALDRQRLWKSHLMYPIHLALSDLLMGIYLIIITWFDVKFRGEYVLHDANWRNGPLCHVAGFLSTLSSETSAIFILLITIDRFVAIKFPFGQFRQSRKAILILCCAAWSLGLLTSSLPLIMPDWEVYSFNSICVGLPLNNDAYTGAEYAMGIFIGMNSFLFLLIAAGQLAIYKAKSATSSKVRLQGDQARRRYKQDMAVARQLSLIAITDFLCWFPVCIMGLLAQNGVTISNSAYAWSAVVVLPINSSINPLLYTLRHLVMNAISRSQQKRNVCRQETVRKSSVNQSSDTSFDDISIEVSTISDPKVGY